MAASHGVFFGHLRKSGLFLIKEFDKNRKTEIISTNFCLIGVGPATT